MEMGTEMEKRKRSHNGESDGRSTRAKEEKGDRTVNQTEMATETATEEEVEEFFAILRRVHEVVRYFGKGKSGGGGGGGGGEEGAAAKRGSGRGWNPSFQWEDFEVAQANPRVNNGAVGYNNNNRKGREKRDVEAVEENLVFPAGLDLNAEPDSVAEMN